MTIIRTLIVMMCMTVVSALAFAQSAPPPPRITPTEAKSRAGDTVTVCGKVVDTKVSRYGLAGRGKPVTFDLDQPEPKPVFFFVAFGSQEGGPKEAVAAYQGKRVCVTGKIETTGEPPVPFIMAADRSQIKPQPEGK
jgi:hypothetical protein